MRLHAACGTVYLDGYHNIDLELPNHYLAVDRFDLVKQNKTTVDNYYKTNVTKDDFLKGKFQKREVVCDEYVDLLAPLTKTQMYEEILGVQIFEHFTYAQGELLLKRWYGQLQIGGILRLHVPDTEEIMREWLAGDGIDWTLRQLYGSQKNGHGIHKAGYTRSLLTAMMQSTGFKDIREVENINNYAAFGLIGTK